MNLSPEEAIQARDELLKELPLEESTSALARAESTIDTALAKVTAVNKRIDDVLAENFRLQDKCERLQAALTAAIG